MSSPKMRRSLRVGSYAGIDIGLHWSVGLIVVLLTMTLSGTILPIWAPGYAGASYFLAAIASAALFLVSIVAHELGHSLVAERNAVKVRGITLFALGGVAQLESEPKSPGVAARIALAGPAVSLAIGVGSLLAAAAAGAIGLSSLAVAGFGWLGAVNLILAVFNMLPALPLDGGRVLQAGLWKRTGDQHGATVRAATVGRYIGWIMVAFGFWQFLQGAAGLWTIFIGFFIITTARGEEFRARMARRRANGEGLADLFGAFDPTRPPPRSPFDPTRPPSRSPFDPTRPPPRPPFGPSAGSDPRGPQPPFGSFGGPFGQPGKPGRPVRPDVIDVEGEPVDEAGRSGSDRTEERRRAPLGGRTG